MPIITLTTDFGTRDGYVGAVKGVIARIAPAATIVDIAHDIPRGDIAHAAWVVKTSTPEYPGGTIHVVVVDPGVGGARANVVARVAGVHGPQLYVGPDNGVFHYLSAERAWVIAEAASVPVSSTFHGRDVFARAAATLANGSLDVCGEPVPLAGELAWGARKPFTGRVIHVDIYGNLITDLPRAEVSDVVVFGDKLLPIVRTYESVAAGELLAYIGSSDTVEIAVRDGRADNELDAKRGDLVTGKPPARESEGPYR